MVVERLGKLHGVLSPGFYVNVPLVDQLKLIDMREVFLPITPQASVTRDNVRVQASGSLFVQAVDPVKVCYGAANPHQAVCIHAQSVMRTEIGKIDLDTLFHNRSILNDGVFNQLRAAVEPWGIKVLRYELTNVEADEQVSRAMDAQSIAERKRRETVLTAEAQRQHDVTISEGHRAAIINEAEAERKKQILLAEANKERTVLAAEAEKAKKQLEAEGTATAIERIAQAISTPNGRDAIVCQLVDSYLAALGQGMQQSSTMFIPQDMSNINSVVAQAMVTMRNMLSSSSSPSSPQASTSTIASEIHRVLGVGSDQHRSEPQLDNKNIIKEKEIK